MTDNKNNKESLVFQAEVSKLLDLVANSLYSEREIFLRELISNSSDACEKLRYQALSKKNILGKDKDLSINIRVSKKNRKIEIEDNGIFYCIYDYKTMGRMGQKTRYKFQIEDFQDSMNISDLNIELLDKTMIMIR